MTVNVLCLRHGGTHLTLDLVKSLTSENVGDVLKAPGSYKIMPSDKMVISWRNPRDLIVSKLRHDLRRVETRKKKTPYLRRHGVDAKLFATLRGDYGPERMSLARDKAVNFLMEVDVTRTGNDLVPGFSHRIPYMMSLLDIARQWANVDGFKLPFEAISNPDEGELLTDNLAEYLGCGGGAEEYRKIYGTGPTFNKQKSDWREWFGRSANSTFERLNGNKTARMMGY